MAGFYEVVLEGRWRGSQTINKFNYQLLGTQAAVTYSLALIKALGFVFENAAIPPDYPPNTFMHELRAATCNEFQFVGVTASALSNPTDFYSTPFISNNFGLIGGGSSPFEAVGMRTNLVTRSVARGTKRFAGVPAGHINTDGTLSQEGLTKWRAVAAKMTENAVYSDEGQNLTFAPVVLGKEKYPIPNKPGRFGYRYYPDYALNPGKVASSIIWEVYLNVRSQVSRQVGRGS